MKIKRGSSRCVFIIANLAFKLPSFYSYKTFLHGLLANMQEVEFSKIAEMKEKLCPIKFYIPLGFLVIMPKVRVLKCNEIPKSNLKEFCDLGNCIIPAEIKYDSFGYYKNKLVAIDYG